VEYKDYYKIMGLPRTASQEEVKRTYRRLARKYHPDVSKEPDAEERFKEINEAYEVLGDSKKRAAYDQLGSGWRTGEEFRPPPEWEQRYWTGAGRFSTADFADLGEFFESLFGESPFRQATRGRGGFARTGESQYAKLVVSLEDSYEGATRTITLQVPEVDSQGYIVNRVRSLRVKIPKGVTQGQQIRLSGQGAPGSGGGHSGDLYLEVAFQPHPLYRPEGKDIYADLPVSPWEAALGAELSVPTLGGEVKMKIPAGSQTGTRLRLKGRGLPGNPPGDHYVVLQVILPKPETEAAREAYRRLAETMPFNPRRRLGVNR
jgi:curved DNA-binding protein